MAGKGSKPAFGGKKATPFGSKPPSAGSSGSGPKPPPFQFPPSKGKGKKK